MVWRSHRRSGAATTDNNSGSFDGLISVCLTVAMAGEGGGGSNYRGGEELGHLTIISVLRKLYFLQTEDSDFQSPSLAMVGFEALLQSDRLSSTI